MTPEQRAAMEQGLKALKEMLAVERATNRPPETVMQAEEKLDRIRKAAAQCTEAIAAMTAALEQSAQEVSDQDRLMWAMHNMSNPFGRHEFGFSQHVLERGSVGDIDDCRTYIDAEIARSRA